jgi:hypothetical protein
MMTYVITIVAMAVLLLLWLAVELAWRRTFGQGQRSSSCGGCQVCTKRCADPGEPSTE